MIDKLKGKINILVLIIILALAPLFIESNFYIHILCLTFLWVIIGSAWNIIGGFVGQLSIGHAAFFGIGAYTSSLLTVHYGIIPWFGMIVGGLVSVVAALIISAPTLRLRGPFFTLATIAFAEVLRLMAMHFRGLTRGAMGLSIPFDPGLINIAFRDRISYYYLFLVLMVIIVAVCYYIQNSRLGYQMVAVREDEDAAESIGVPTTKVKIIAMLLSAFITSIAGSLYAQYLFYIDPFTVMFITISVQMVLVAAIGGLGKWQGPILGAFVVIPLGEILRANLGGDYRGLHFVIFSVVLMLVVIYIPGGIFPWLQEHVQNIVRSISGKISKPRSNEGGA